MYTSNTLLMRLSGKSLLRGCGMICVNFSNIKNGHLVTAIKRFMDMPRWVVLFLLSTYQVYFRSIFSTGCYFYPSCSEYAKGSVIHAGVIKSIIPIVWRLCRCHPFGKSSCELIIDDVSDRDR